MDAELIQKQLEDNRRTVSFDSYDISVRELFNMVTDGTINISPAYQRHFKWNKERQSQLIESLFLGIPVPSIYMATNKDSTWDVVDGLQRLTTIMNFFGSDGLAPGKNKPYDKLELTGLEKLDSINCLKFEDMPKTLQVMFYTRSLKVTVLNDKSDYAVRYDLFERLNTGGVTLHPQEIRNCIFTGEFNEFLKLCVGHSGFRAMVKLAKDEERSGSLEELVLRFFAYFEGADEFVHGVKDFLNGYMEEKCKNFKNRGMLEKIFDETFSVLGRFLPNGIVRSNRKNTTPIVLYEAISVGAAIVISKGKQISREKIINILDDAELKTLTTGATNSRKMVKSRIQYVAERVMS